MIARALPTLRRHEDAIPVGIVGALALAVLVATMIVGGTSADAHQVGVYIRQAVIVAIAAIGQSIVVIAGGIDMSVGANSQVAALIAATVLVDHPEVAPFAIPIALACGVLVGLINGSVIVAGRATPFIVTLGMFAILQGVGLMIATEAISGLPTWYFEIYDAEVFGIPIAVFGLVVLVFLAWVLLHRTRLGRAFYAIGGNAETARLAGIRVNRVTIAAYAICGLFAALSGLFALSQAQVGAGTIGHNLEFASITAVALGGVSLFGGRGYLVGAIAGALLLSFLLNLLGALGLSAFVQELVQGAVILAAVAIYKPASHR